MSWKATARVKELTHDAQGYRLSRSEKLLLLLLADYYNDDAGAAWVSIKRLAADALMSERQAQRLIICLQKRGILEVTVRKGKTSIYRFKVTTSDVTPDTMSPLTSDVVTGYDISEEGLRHPDVVGSYDIAMSPEPSCQPSVDRTVIEPSVSRSSQSNGFREVAHIVNGRPTDRTDTGEKKEIWEWQGKRFEVTYDRHGGERLRPLDEPETDLTSTDHSQKRWTLTDDDPGDFNPGQLLNTYNELTGNPLTKSDEDIAEIIGATMQFSGLACVALMKVISKKAKKKIGSLAYFRAGIREVHELCLTAAIQASALSAGSSAREERGAEIRAVRQAAEEWGKKGG